MEGMFPAKAASGWNEIHGHECVKRFTSFMYLCRMRILIVAATEGELAATKNHYSKSVSTNLTIDFLVTGVGMTATAYSLTKRLTARKYDLAINIGLAGSFRHEISLGDVVNVVSDSFADLGAEDGEKFISIFDLQLQHNDSFPFWNGKIKNDHVGKYSQLHYLKNVKAITVNKVHGNNESIQNTLVRYHPDIETMEGAAFFYVCSMERVPFLQLRAISNRVELRNRGAWKMDLALGNLSSTVRSFLDEVTS
jgi:futalosine hydrolase